MWIFHLQSSPTDMALLPEGGLLVPPFGYKHGLLTEGGSSSRRSAINMALLTEGGLLVPPFGYKHGPPDGGLPLRPAVGL